MVDVVSAAVRSRMMSGIRATNTKPEILIRKGLHRKGFRFRLHDKKLTGKPDIVFPKHGAVIFVQGCFWHGHSCHLFKWPKSREEFWHKKITSNQNRDKKNIATLVDQGWRVGQVWECSIKGRNKLAIECLLAKCSDWLFSDTVSMEIFGDA